MSPLLKQSSQHPAFWAGWLRNSRRRHIPAPESLIVIYSIFFLHPQLFLRVDHVAVDGSDSFVNFVFQGI